MRLRPGVTVAALALVLCCLGEASTESQSQVTEAQVAAPQARGRRGLRKGVQGVRRVRAGVARPSKDIGVDGYDDTYLVNEERAFRGSTYRELEVNRDRALTDSRTRGFGDSRNRGGDRAFTPETRDRDFASNYRGLTSEPRERENAYEARDRNFAPASKDNEFSLDSRDRGFAPEARGYDPTRSRADTDSGESRKPYNYRSNEGRDLAPNKDVVPATRNYGSPSLRDFDASRGRDTSLKDYYRNSGDSRSSDSQRWLKILAEFLKSSSEGRELLRARADQLLVGADVDAGQLPLPLLLVPVPVQDQQCAAPNPGVASPQHNVTDVTKTPITPEGRQRPFGGHRTLIKLFREERPRAPLLPPLLLPTSPRPAPAVPPPPRSSAPPPARLRFDRSLLIRAELTVYYSDYTEPYTVWYDADTGSSRVDMHGGTAVLYRTVQPGGDVERTQLRIERYEGDEKWACTRLTSSVVEADRLLPCLPDLEPFHFDGHVDTADGRMERWTHTLAGQAGELGAARGEALVFRHELLVARVGPDFAIPYRYRVTVDSSVLGPEVDWYEHRYLEVREQRPDPSYMSIDVKRECDSVRREYRVQAVDPLREFVMTHRDTRCDTDFEKYKETYEVNYKDDVEEAVRKTMLIRNTRFVESANRQGSSALLAVNVLAVLLQAELQRLLGIVDDDAALAGAPGEVGASPVGASPPGEVGASSPGKANGPSFAIESLKPEPFPYTPEEVSRLAAELPAAFSWKQQGAVTHVRNQGLCTTCWAFAVVAAVEAALFNLTKKLVPLSDQQLVDCTKGLMQVSCESGNHVKYAYQRIRDAGIVPLGEYPRYDFLTPKVDQCRKEDPVVTKISGFVEVTNSSDALKVSIVKKGPNVVLVDARCEGFRYFNAGVLIDRRCNPDGRNHAVTAIGYDKDENKPHRDYFIVKNSWGLAGVGGYVHLDADTNTAGVHTAPSYPLLTLANVVANEEQLKSFAKNYSDERSAFNTTNTKEIMAFLDKQKEYI